MTPRQSAMVLTLLAAQYGGVLVLFAPELNFGEFHWLPVTVAGLVVASPAFLALWAVHGRQRATVRLPLTTWLCSLYFLAAVYGEVRYFGTGDSDIVLLTLVAWTTGYLADLFLLRLLRAVRGWRLERIEIEPGSVATAEASEPRNGPKRQFTIRTLLVWTTAAAALFAGLRLLTPYGVFDENGLPQGALEGVLFEGAVLGLIFALAGLPIIPIALIVLTDGRRTIWRCVLAVVTALGIAGGAEATRLIWPDEGNEIVVLALALEAGVLLAGLAATAITRACGYRLVRGMGDRLPVRTPSSPLESSSRGRGFAWALAALATTSLLLACYAPRRLETWRRADEWQQWESLGWAASFDDEGHVTELTSVGKCDIEGTTARIGQLSHLEYLQFGRLRQSNAVLAILPPLPELKTMIVDEITDAGLSHLERFPNLESLIVSGKRFTDAGLLGLTTLTQLKDLCLAGTGVLLDEAPPFPQLKSLNLQKTHVGDASLSHLDRFPNLQTLNLSRTNVTDEGLGALRGLKSLTILNLRMTDIGDESLPVLCGLSKLRSLDLELTAVSEAGFRELRGALPDTSITVGADDAVIERAIFAYGLSIQGLGRMVSTRGGQSQMLKYLHARGKHLMEPRETGALMEKPGAVTDDGLALLSGQTTMEELDLRDSAVTDAGLKSLAKLSSLKRLDLRGTHVTEHGRQRLAKTLPNCEILR